MSIEQEAEAAAIAAYPRRFPDAVSEDPVFMALDAGVRMSRVPFAHGYQRGYARGGIDRTREIIELIQEDHHALAVMIDAKMAELHPDEIKLVDAEMRAQS